MKLKGKEAETLYNKTRTYNTLHQSGGFVTCLHQIQDKIQPVRLVTQDGVFHDFPHSFRINPSTSTLPQNGPQLLVSHFLVHKFSPLTSGCFTEYKTAAS
jgi:hypothetical protein